MADDFHTPHVNVTGTYTGVDQGGEHQYTFQNTETGATATATSSYAPEDTTDPSGKVTPGFINILNDIVSPAGAELTHRLAATFRTLQTQDQRNFLARGVAPIVRSLVGGAYFAGGVPDILALLSYIPGPDKLAAMGYEAVTGETPAFLKESREGAESFREAVEPYGFLGQQKRFERYLRQADAYTEDKWGFRLFGDTIGTDMTPEARGFWEELVTEGMEFGVSGVPMVKSVTLPLKAGQALIKGAERIFRKLAKESVEELGEAAVNPKNARTLVDKANDFYSISTQSGRRNIRGDVYFGLAAGPSTVVALHSLEAVDPDAAGWFKATTAIASGILLPVLTRGAVTSLVQMPLVYRFFTESIWDPVFRPTKSAERFTQRHGLGPTEANKVEIAGVGRILEEAYAQGRHVHQASGLAFTTPELARAEANILHERTLIKRDELAEATDPAVIERLTKEISEAENQVSSLVRYANFQEDILTAASRDKSPGAIAKFFDAEANRLVERREQFFNYVENQFQQSFDNINFNGRSGGTPAEHRLDLDKALNGAIPEFETTRRNLVMRGNIKGIEAAELQWLTPSARNQSDNAFAALDANLEKSFNNAKAAAAERVKFWRESVDSYLAAKGLKTVEDLSASEKIFVGDLIRGSYDDAYREIRGFEKAAYRRVKGIDDKVTENIVFPEGSVDRVSGESIAGMEISDWAAKSLENLTRSQKFNPRDVPIELAQLVGMRSIIAVLNKQRKAAEAAGRAVEAEASIPTLEGIKNQAITRRQQIDAELKAQLSADRKAAEKQIRSLRDYVEGVTTKLDDTQTAAVNAFLDDPNINWEIMTLTMAKGRAPKGLESIFSSIAKQKKKIAELGEGTTVSPAVKTIQDSYLAVTKEVDNAQDQINQITGRFLEGMDDAPIAPTGRLTSRNSEGKLVSEGTSPQDVKEAISDIAEAASREKRVNGTTPKYRHLIQLQTTLEQVLTPAVFPNLDVRSLNFAKEASQLKHRVSEAQADILARDKGAGVEVQVEKVGETVLPAKDSVTIQSANLRLLETAAAEVPPFVTIKRDENGRIVRDAEGIPVAVIDENAITGESLFNLPDSPFEKVLVGEAGLAPVSGFYEIRLRPNAPATDRALKIAESILLERLALQFPEGVDSKTLGSFRKENKLAIKFLKDNGRDTVPNLVGDADALARQLDALDSLFSDRTRKQLTVLVDSGSLNLGANTIDDYVQYIGQRRQRIGEENALRSVLEADPGRATTSLFDKILNPQNNQPKKDLQEFLSVVRGNQSAEKGFKASVIGELWRRATTHTDELGRATGDLAARAFDPALFRELMADSKIRMMLQEVFPDNGALLNGLDKMAAVAFETANFTKGSKSLARAIDPQTALSLEAYSNLGRILALNVAARVDFLNALVLAGVGGRYGAKLGRSLTGSKIKDILVIAALDPAKAIELSKSTSKHVDGFLANLRRAAIDTVLAPVAVPLGRPAATGAIIRYGEQQRDEYGRQKIEPIPEIIPSAEPPVPPLFPTGGGASLQVPSPREGTMLSQIDPFTMQRGQEVFGPMDRVFAANKGGLASLQRKPRQMVH